MHSAAQSALEAWHKEAQKGKWGTPTDIKALYPSASFVKNNLVVFNIKGNSYRLVCCLNYEFGQIYIKFVGTHADYDKINVKDILCE